MPEEIAQPEKCGFEWITPGDGVHYPDLHHTCKESAGHPEAHICHCKFVTSKLGISPRELRNKLVDICLSRPECASFTIMIGDKKRLSDISIDEETRTIELRGEKIS